MKFLKQLKNRKGAALVEYGLLVAGIALVTAAAVSVFGHKTSDLLATTAGVLPGVHDDDNAPIASGKIIETTQSATLQNPGGTANAIVLDVQGIVDNSGTSRLQNNLGFDDGTLQELVVETQ